jgi:hypothetical protein
LNGRLYSGQLAGDKAHPILQRLKPRKRRRTALRVCEIDVTLVRHCSSSRNSPNVRCHASSATFAR